MLLKELVAELHTRRKSFFVKDREYPRYFFIGDDEFKAHLSSTPSPHFHVPYRAARKKLLREAVVMKAVETLPRAFFVGQGYVHYACS